MYVCNGFLQFQLGSHPINAARSRDTVRILCNYLHFVGATTYIFVLQLSVFLLYNKQTDEEVAKYSLHKLQLSGAFKITIDEPALFAVHSHTQGNLRLIDNLMTDALTIGVQTDKKVIAEVIHNAVGNQGLY